MSRVIICAEREKSQGVPEMEHVRFEPRLGGSGFRGFRFRADESAGLGVSEVPISMQALSTMLSTLTTVINY